MGEPRIARGIERKPRAADRVSRTARKLFYERGIRAVGVEEIVAEAGVTKPSLYRNFASKDELVTTCLQARFDQVMAWWDALEDRLSEDPLGQVRAIIATVVEQTGKPISRGCGITNAAVEFPEANHPTHRIAQQYKIAMRGRLLRLVERLPIERPALLTDGLILLFEGARASRHTSGAHGPAASMQQVADALLDSFLCESIAAAAQRDCEAT
jgi:AcrR family transcriptional regulator